MNTKNTIKAAIALLSGAALLIPMPALANRFTDQVRGQLMEAAVRIGFRGYQLTHNPFVDALGNNGSDVLTLNLRAGVSYAIVGVCDEDCSDLDMQIFDENGNRIDFDNRSNDVPVVTVTPRRTGRFRVKVDMPSCSAAPCYYGVGVFGR
jgi:hypothetical protein